MTRIRSFQLSRFSFGEVGAPVFGRALGVVLGFLLVAVPAAARADVIVFAEDTIIGGGEWTGYDVVVRGCTLTINGAVSFNSLTVDRDEDNHPGVVTYAPPFSNWLQITIATDLYVQGAEDTFVASRIDISGKGFTANQSPGAGGDCGYYGSGAGYGGIGGISAGGCVGGGAYDFGSLTSPVQCGSGGGGWDGGAGGGAIKLNVTGAATIDGTLTANGSGAGSYGGGGSGGSIWLAGGTIAGGGTISANGGNAPDGYRGSGGGGRIALYTCDLQMLPTQITATGGHVGAWGADGTVFHGSAEVVITQQPVGQIVLVGDPVTLTIVASTTQGMLHYQWRKNGQNLSENPPHLTGTQTPALLIDAALTGDIGNYDVLLTDDCGDFASTAASLQVLLLGDMNCDGVITLADIEPFALALTDPVSYQDAYPNCLIELGDMDGDGAVNGEDIGLFVGLFVP